MKCIVNESRAVLDNQSESPPLLKPIQQREISSLPKLFFDSWIVTVTRVANLKVNKLATATPPIRPLIEAGDCDKLQPEEKERYR